MKVHFKSKVGTRSTNEDRHTIILNSEGKDPTRQSIDIFGIYDGHGGSHVASILANIVPKIFLDKRVVYPLHKSYVTKVCNHIQQILQEDFANKSKECGSTCLLIIKFKHNNDDMLNIINVGDSRAILCSGKTVANLTVDHKPLNPEEKQRITNSGGNVVFDGLEWRVSSLSLSRAFGDTSSKFTPPIPDLFSRKISPNDRFIIMACDGLWDVVDNQTAANLVMHYCYDSTGQRRVNDKLNIAAKLADYALLQGSSDNVTVIVIFLR